MKIRLTFSALALLAIAGTTHAQGVSPQQARSWAAGCANCHGTQGKGVSEGSVPGLAGLKADYIEAQMKAFKSGERPATIMHQLSKGYSDEQIRLLATYFASQKP